MNLQPVAPEPIDETVTATADKTRARTGRRRGRPPVSPSGFPAVRVQASFDPLMYDAMHAAASRLGMTIPELIRSAIAKCVIGDVG